jgi:hypothetical protein
MGLHIRRSSSKKVQLIITLFAAFILVAQPSYGVLSSQMAAAVANPIAPTVPSGGQPNGGYEPTNNFDFTWDSSSDLLGGSITYEFQSTQDPTESDGVLTTGLRRSDSLSSPTVHSSDASDGIWYWQVRAINQSGSASAWSSIWQVTVDSQTPIAIIKAPALTSGMATIGGVVTDANPDHYSFVIKDINGAVVAGPGTVDQATVADWQWDTAGQDGRYTIELEVQDKAGYKSTASEPIIADNTSPNIQITNPGPFTTVDKTKQATISGTATDMMSGASTVEVRVEKANSSGACEGNVGSFTVGVTGDDWSSQFDTSGLESGNYCIIARATDAAGNKSADSQPDYFSVDNQAPHVTMSLASSATPMASTDSIILKGNVTGGPASLVLKTIKGGDSLEDIDLTGSVDGEGNWMYVMTKEKVVQGTYKFSLVASDQYGNINAQDMPTVEVVVGPYIPQRGSTISSDLVTPFAPNFINSNAFAVTSPFKAAQAQTKPDTAVLGAETTKDLATQSSDTPVVATASGWKIFGIAWYWWMLIVMMILVGIWWTVTTVRRRADQPA